MAKAIIYAGVGSPSWDTEANELADELERQGVEVVEVIPVNGLDCPRVEYLKDKKVSKHSSLIIQKSKFRDMVKSIFPIDGIKGTDIVIGYERCKRDILKAINKL